MKTLAGIGAYHELKKIVGFTESSLKPLSFHTTVEDEDNAIEIHYIEFNDDGDESTAFIDDDKLEAELSGRSALSVARGENISSPNVMNNQKNIANMKSFVDNSVGKAKSADESVDEGLRAFDLAGDESRRDELEAATHYSDDFVLVSLEEEEEGSGSIRLVAHIRYVEPSGAFSAFGDGAVDDNVEPLFSVVIMDGSVEQKNWRGSLFEGLSKILTNELAEDDSDGSFFNII